MIDAARPPATCRISLERKMPLLSRQNTMSSWFVLHVVEVVSLQQQKDNAGWPCGPRLLLKSVREWAAKASLSSSYDGQRLVMTASRVTFSEWKWSPHNICKVVKSICDPETTFVALIALNPARNAKDWICVWIKLVCSGRWKDHDQLSATAKSLEAV